MSETKHILTDFGDALAALRADASMMASLTERSLQNAMACLLHCDQEACVATIADEDEIGALEKKIDGDGVEILVRFQPVASDLRKVIATMRFGSNLERVADQATKIARRGRKLENSRVLSETKSIDLLFLDTRILFRDSVSAFTNSDVDLAHSLLKRDRKLDEINRLIETQLTEQIGLHPEQISDRLNLIFIARHLERVGNHAKNIAEDAVYAVVAEGIRHPNNSL
jgi:phosphate transport system protein